MIAPPASDESLKIALGVLGTIYGIAALSVLIFVVLPRWFASGCSCCQTVVLAGRPRYRGRRRIMARVARPPRPYDVRWSPAYVNDTLWRRPGQEFESGQMTRPPTTTTGRFPAPTQLVSALLYFFLLYSMKETLCTDAFNWSDDASTYLLLLIYSEIRKLRLLGHICRKRDDRHRFWNN